MYLPEENQTQMFPPSLHTCLIYLTNFASHFFSKSSCSARVMIIAHRNAIYDDNHFWVALWRSRSVMIRLGALSGQTQTEIAVVNHVWLEEMEVDVDPNARFALVLVRNVGTLWRADRYIHGTRNCCVSKPSTQIVGRPPRSVLDCVCDLSKLCGYLANPLFDQFTQSHQTNNTIAFDLDQWNSNQKHRTIVFAMT